MSLHPLAAPVLSANADSDSDSDWEYEYSTETESFYLNLDLTSLHGPIRPPRRRNATASAPNNNEPDADPEPDADADFSRPLETTESDARHAGASASASASASATAQDRLQILGLHTLNPIVSYQNQVFSCSWAEQIGTELFFTRPDELAATPTATTTAEIDVDAPLARGKDFDLIAATSVKILGRKANLISSSEPSTTTPSASTSTSNPPKPSTSSNQARFLERLSSVKQAKGETDTVRTVYSTRRTQNLEDRLRGWARTEEQLAEVQRLQEAVLRGDEGAMAALERVYRDLQGEGVGDRDGAPSLS